MSLRLDQAAQYADVLSLADAAGADQGITIELQADILKFVRVVEFGAVAAVGVTLLRPLWPVDKEQASQSA